MDGALGTGTFEDCGLVGESLLSKFTIRGRNIHSRSPTGCDFFERYERDIASIDATQFWLKDADART